MGITWHKKTGGTVSPPAFIENPESLYFLRFSGFFFVSVGKKWVKPIFYNKKYNTMGKKMQ